MEEISKLVQAQDSDGLTALLSDYARDVRVAAAQALGQLRDDDTVPALVGAMGDEEVQVRQAAADALVRIGEASISALLGTLEGQGGRLAPYALWALGEIGSPAAVDALAQQAAQASAWRIRWSAVEALGEVGGERAVQTLIRDAPEEDMNQELRIALSEIEFGATRAAALSHLAKRIPLEPLHSVIAAINQAEKLGTPLSTILKLQADMLRMHRGVRAEKLSASASLRILVPSTMILMAVVVIVFSPMIIRALRGELL